MKKEIIFDKCLETWGMTTQMTKLSEESCELAIAVMKWSYHDYKIDDNTLGEIADIAEETADVLNMIDQLRYFVNKKLKESDPTADGQFDQMINTWKEFKMKRVSERMGLKDVES